MKTTVGRPISVGDVLSKSTSLLMKTPALLIPQVIVLVLSLLEDLTKSFSAAYIVLAFVSVVVSIVIFGAYPSMIQAALAGTPISIAKSLEHASKRFLTLLVAGILLAVIISVGFALVIPGLIFVTWYAYTVPAIMLENKGALAGMSASKVFGRDKKWSTFKLIVAVFAVAVVLAIIMAVVDLGSQLAGHVVYSLLSLPLDAWIAIIITYTYLTYGPSSVSAATEPPAPGYVPPAGTVPPAPMNQATPASTSSRAGYCRSCGSPLSAGSKFCPNCGQPV